MAYLPPKWLVYQEVLLRGGAIIIKHKHITKKTAINKFKITLLKLV